MKCRQAQELIGAYLYGDLSAEEMRDSRVHAQECTLCREDLASRGRIVSSLDDSVPALSDEERQRIAWSVRGAVRKEQYSRKPLAARLVPTFALAGVIVAGVFVGRYVISRSASPPAHRTVAKSPAGPSVKIKELPPADKNANSDQLADQVSELIQSLMYPSATLQPDRASASTRALSPDRHYVIPQENPFIVTPVPRVETRPAPAPPTPDADVTNPPKDSVPEVNKSDTGTDSEATQLPRVTDPKNAETTPSDNN